MIQDKLSGECKFIASFKIALQAISKESGIL